MKEMQFSVVVMMVLMCSALIMLMPDRVRRDTVINRSRWLMAGALGLIGVQFLVQYIMELRMMGLTQAVLVNLTFFVPASSLMNLTILNLQRQGRLTRMEWWGWMGIVLVVVTGLAMAVITDGHPIAHLSERVLWTEIGMSFVYAAMQAYYCFLQFRELLRMEEVIEDYYDHDHKGLIKWMKYAIAVNGLMAIFVPSLIFGPNIVIVIFSLFFFWGIFMMWFSFVSYFTSNAMKRVREAEESAIGDELEGKSLMSESVTLDSETMQNVSRAVDHWLSAGAHLKTGITSPLAAEAMGIPRYQLTAWVKASGYQSFTKWIIAQRIEEAKRVIREHRYWSNEAVADHCGFSRDNFQKIFKQHTGVSPSEYA